MYSMARSGDFRIRYKQHRQKGRNGARGVMHFRSVLTHKGKVQPKDEITSSTSSGEPECVQKSQLEHVDERESQSCLSREKSKLKYNHVRF
jgi:hypothetical protein